MVSQIVPTGLTSPFYLENKSEFPEYYVRIATIRLRFIDLLVPWGVKV